MKSNDEIFNLTFNLVLTEVKDLQINSAFTSDMKCHIDHDRTGAMLKFPCFKILTCNMILCTKSTQQLLGRKKFTNFVSTVHCD